MKHSQGYKRIPLSFNRKTVIASASVSKETNMIHSITEVDITKPRRLIKEHFALHGEKLSFTGYIVTCLAHTIKELPLFNSFIKGSQLIILDDLTISVLVERDIAREKVPEPIGIQKAQMKNLVEITNEIREAKKEKRS